MPVLKQMRLTNQREMEVVFEPELPSPQVPQMTEEDRSSHYNKYETANRYPTHQPENGQKSSSVQIGVSADAESMLATFNSTIYSCSPGMAKLW